MHSNPTEYSAGCDPDNFPPTVFIVGAQKAGTTYLASLLSQTRHVTLSKPKEPHFFTKNWECGLAWYRRQFPSPHGRILMDASVSYTAAPVHLGLDAAGDCINGRRAGVPGRIHSVSPNARFIYLLRDPVDRVWSSYWHDVRYANLRASLKIALEQEPCYIDASDYLAQISLYQRTFPVDRFLFLRFEDLRNDPEYVVDKCLQFLKLPAARFNSLIADSSKHSSYQAGRVARWLIRQAQQRPVVNTLESRVWNAMPLTLKQRARQLLTKPVPSMDPHDYAQLVERFAPMLDELETLTRLDLSVWPWVPESR